MTCLSLYAIFKIDDMQFAIIGIVGETITELIAGIVLVIHNKSALQLNYYYDALHKNSVKDHGKHNDGKKNGIQLIITGKNFTEAF